MNKALRILALAFLDIFFFTAVWLVALLLGQCGLEQCLSETWYFYVGGAALVCVLNICTGLSGKSLWHMNFSDATRVLVVAIAMVVYFFIVGILDSRYGIVWAFIVSILFFFVSTIERFSIRLYNAFAAQFRRQMEMRRGIRVAVVGAGAAGVSLINTLRTSDKFKLNPVCLIDDDDNKQGREIAGVKVAGKVADVADIVAKMRVEEIIVAMPSVGKKRIKEILEICQTTKCKIKITPDTYQMLNRKSEISDVKPISITDLLGREQVKINIKEIVGYIEGKVVLVTGGGGSIGSELCRQISGQNPGQLIILDIYENNAYDIQQELIRKYPNLRLTVLIASVRDKKRIDKIFEKYKPDIVFHAAAHKHVPLMEDSPNEAVKNNIYGTFQVAEAAGKNGVKRFILISTDKAVNPTNIMGASKRVCEMIIQAMNNRYGTEYVVVRFGNVLGSNGSVIPLFMKQIAEGGPVTVTDKNIVRYFMTIPEAVSLVLQAGAYAKGGEIFVLDMGDPVRIYDLAEKMIRLSGYVPNKDIEIKIVGLRPGEKLYEERLMAEEGLQKTANDLISIGKPLSFDEEKLFAKIQELRDAAYEETDKMKQLVHELVTTYKIDERNSN